MSLSSAVLRFASILAAKTGADIKPCSDAITTSKRAAALHDLHIIERDNLLELELPIVAAGCGPCGAGRGCGAHTDMICFLSQQDIANLTPQSPKITIPPPRTKQRVSEISCLMSGPDVARDSAIASPTTGQPSCFVETCLLVPHVPEGYVVPSHCT